MTLPNYRLQKASPVISSGVTAHIEIACPAVIESGESSLFPLHGSFVVPEIEESKTNVHILQAVVLLIRGNSPASRQVGEGEIFFPNDVRRESGSIFGHFNLDLFSHFKLARQPGKYWVSASLFNHVSNVISVEVV